MIDRKTKTFLDVEGKFKKGVRLNITSRVRFHHDLNMNLGNTRRSIFGHAHENHEEKTSEDKYKTK